MIQCCFCEKYIYERLSNNPEPLANAPKRCCNECNVIVIMHRMELMFNAQ